MEKNARILKWPVLLFDFDGTLVSTEEIAQKAIHEYFEKNKIPDQSEFAQLIIGRTWAAAAEAVVERARIKGVAIEKPNSLVMEWKRRYLSLLGEGVHLIPGVRERLVEIKQAGAWMGIVTGSEREEVDRILHQTGLSEFFSRLWTSADYSVSKPDPAPYLQAICDLGVDPGQVLVFEDSVPGVESAHQAGLPFIQVLHGSYTWPDERSLKRIQNWHSFDLNWLFSVGGK